MKVCFLIFALIAHGTAMVIRGTTVPPSFMRVQGFTISTTTISTTTTKSTTTKTTTTTKSLDPTSTTTTTTTKTTTKKSTNKNVKPEECSNEDIYYQGDVLNEIKNVPNAKQCHKHCRDLEECQAFVFESKGKDKLCLLLKDMEDAIDKNWSSVRAKNMLRLLKMQTN